MPEMEKPKIKDDFSIGDIPGLIENYGKYYGSLALERLDVPLQGLATVVFRSIHEFTKHGPREAAALSYYALFSLFPLLLLLVVGIGQIVGPAATGTQINDFLSLFLPGETATEITRNLERFVSDGRDATLISLFSLAYSGLGLFSNLEGALSRTFHDEKFRPFLKRRAAGFAMVVVLGVLLVANIFTSLIFSFVGLLFIEQSSIWQIMVGIFIPFGFSMGIFAMMYRFIPRTQVGWDAIWPAAMVGGAAWEAAKRIFGLYLDAATNLSLVYGSLTTVIIFMLWAYVTCSIILLCAELCMHLADWLEERKQENPSHELHFASDYYERKLKLDPIDNNR